MLSSKTQPNYDVAIVGGGFSGTVLAAQLIRRLPGGHSIVVVDRDRRPGRGVAYRTDCRLHLLNVCAGNMSALPDEPDHFLKWILARVDPSADSDQFLTRFLYGEYLEDLLRRELASRPEVLFSWSVDDVVAIHFQRGLVSLKMRTGNVVDARVAVLASGNYPPGTPLQLRGVSRRCYSPYAWSQDALAQMPNGGTVLLLGTGLTAIDQVLSLRAADFSGNIIMLSRHGLLPFVHNTEAPPLRRSTLDLPRTIRSLFRTIRREVSTASANGIPWHTVVDSLRPETQQIWKAFPLSEQRRFLRHVRVYWEIHRHRIPAESSRILEELIVEGRVTIVAGRLLKCIESGKCIRITLRERRSGKEVCVSPNLVINCSGYETGARLFEDPAVKSMLDVGIARVDVLGLGLNVADNGALIDALGTASRSLFAIGPIRKGCLWETTAVPEIRCQAAEIANYISSEIKGLTARP